MKYFCMLGLEEAIFIGEWGTGKQSSDRLYTCLVESDTSAFLGLLLSDFNIIVGLEVTDLFDFEVKEVGGP